MLGCNESNIIFSSSISANFGQAMKKRPTGHTIWPEKESYGCHTFVLFCELVEGEENKLTTFSTWTIMLGCNESNIIPAASLQTWATPEKQW